MSALAGKVAVVTGCSSGIGAASCAKLVAAGARVFGLSRRAELASPEGVEPLAVDLAEPAARAEVVERLLAATEGIDLLVNNAGIATWAQPLSMDLDAWKRLFELNLWAAVDLCQRLAPRLGVDGQVIHVTSVSGRHLAASRFGPYGMSKAALDGFAEALRVQTASTGLRVCTIAPGLVDTPIYEHIDGFDRTEARIRERVPRWLDPEDVAEAVLWVATRPAHVSVADLVLLPRHQER